MSTTDNEIAKQKIDYLFRQLDLAHKRNEHVDKLRFNLLQIFFSFQAIIIGATVLKGNDITAIKQNLGDAAVFVPILVLIIGYSLFVAFFRWHITMYKYKRWIRNTEIALTSILYKREPPEDYRLDYAGTLYLDKNVPTVTFEGIVVFMLVAMGVLNIGLVLLLLQVFGISSLATWLIVGLGTIAHIGTIMIMSKFHWH
jgi:hypothetical protein